MSRRIFLAMIAILTILVLTDSILHVAGLTSVPTYRPDHNYGYIPEARQNGAFLGRYRWTYNERSMGVADAFHPAGVVLIGDSIVNGGSKIDQPDRLGPRIAADLGEPVWPISATSWSLLNELSYLRANPDVAHGPRVIAFVLNSEDFKDPSVWSESPDRPRHRPLSAIAFAIHRKLLRPNSSPPPPTGRSWKTEMAAFRKATDARVIVFLYPKRGEALSVVERHIAELGPEVVSIGRDARWRAATYADDTHVNAQGTEILAKIVEDHVRAAPLPSQAHRR